MLGLKSIYSPIGLDLGATAVRGVQLGGTGAAARVHAAYQVELPTPAAGKPAEGQLEAALGKLLRRGGFAGPAVVLHAPSDRLDMRPITLPAGAAQLDRAALLASLRLQVADHLAFSADEAVIDFYNLEKPTANQDITVMAVSVEGAWVRRRMRQVQGLGLDCVRLDPLGCALSRIGLPGQAENPATGKNPVQAILDIGAEYSTLIVSDRRGPVFCRHFPFAGNALTAQIAQQIHLAPDQARKFKHVYGLEISAGESPVSGKNLPGEIALNSKSAPVGTLEAPPSRSPEVGRLIFSALRKELHLFCEGLMRSLNYVTNEYPGACLERVVLAGGGAQLRNLDRFLASEFELPVNLIADPLLAEIARICPLGESGPGAWATALGLARAGEDEP